MAINDSTDKVSDTLEDLISGSKRKIIIVGDIESHFDEWMDLLCGGCDNSLMVIQLNNSHSKIKIICSGCGREEEIKIEKIIVEEKNSG